MSCEPDDAPTALRAAGPSRLCSVLLAFGLAGCGETEPVDVTVSLDLESPAQTLHTAWAVNLHPGFFLLDPHRYERYVPLYRDRLVELVVDELGFHRGALGVWVGAENPRDTFGEWWHHGRADRDDWRAVRNVTVNDDGDPFHLEPRDPTQQPPHDFVGFHFTQLDLLVEDLVLDLLAHTEARGIDFYLQLSVIDFEHSGFELKRHPEEYAEFVLAVFLHLDRKYGVVPDALEIKLEPDMGDVWAPRRLGKALLAASRRLAEHGYTPEISAPSCTSVRSTIEYFDELASMPGVVDAISELSYHRYGGAGPELLRALRDRARRHGLRTAMLEWWKPENDVGAMLEDLTHADAAVVQRGMMASHESPNRLPRLYFVDVSETDRPVLRPNVYTPAVRLLTTHVRDGAVRYGTTSDHADVTAAGFVNEGGGGAVVVDASRPARITLTGLPAGRYGATYRAGAETVDEPPRSLAAGEPWQSSLPGEGVLVVYALDENEPPTR